MVALLSLSLHYQRHLLHHFYISISFLPTKFTSHAVCSRGDGKTQQCLRRGLHHCSLGGEFPSVSVTSAISWSSFFGNSCFSFHTLLVRHDELYCGILWPICATYGDEIWAKAPPMLFIVEWPCHAVLSSTYCFGIPPPLFDLRSLEFGDWSLSGCFRSPIHHHFVFLSFCLFCLLILVNL